MTINVYALYATDEPELVRYVGATKRKLAHRLRAHLTHYCNPLKRKWFREVQARGAKVAIRLLSAHEDPFAASKAEQEWANFWSGRSALLNGNKSWYPNKAKLGVFTQ